MSNQNHNADWGGKREGAGRPRAFARVKVSDLQALASNWQALCNIAEVKAPELLDDQQWLGLKARLEEQAQKLGVEAWARKAIEKRVRHMEMEDDDAEGI